MRIAFLANTHGNLDLVERCLIMLADREQVDAIAAVGNAAYDVEAAMRGRQQRFPVAVEWADPGYPDYVLASVLGGVVEAPAHEVERSARIEGLLFTESSVVIGPITVGIERTSVRESAEAKIVVQSRPETTKIQRGDPIRICPGHVRAHEYERAPATCLILEEGANGAVHVRFIGIDGHQFGTADLLGN